MRKQKLDPLAFFIATILILLQVKWQDVHLVIMMTVDLGIAVKGLQVPTVEGTKDHQHMLKATNYIVVTES